MAAHLQYMPGDPRLVDQLVCELKSKGIFDQFRKDCIADVDTRPAYQNLRQRVESSVSSFLSRQVWRPDLNKNQLREKLRKHLLDGNYLEQGVERIVDQVVNPKVASVFIPQVEDLVYNYLGITRKKTVSTPETSKEKDNTENDLLPTDLEAVSPGSVKSNDDKEESMEISEDTKEEMEIELEDEHKTETIIVEENSSGLPSFDKERVEVQDTQMSGASDVIIQDSDISMDKSNIPLPAEEIKLENIPAPENSPPKDTEVELENIELPREPNVSTDIPLPDEVVRVDKESFFKPMLLHSEDDDDSSSDSSLIRNMSPLTPIRNYNNENSYDAQPGFDNDSTDNKCDEKKPSSFKFTLDAKSEESTDVVNVITEKKEGESALSYQFSNQVNLNTFNNQIYDDSSNSHNLQIDYESDVNSKTNNTFKKESDIDTNQNGNQTREETTKDTKTEDKKCHKSSHRSRDAHRHSSSSKDRRSDSKHSSSRDKKDPRHDKKPSKDDHSKSKSSHKDRSKDRSEKKDGRDSSKHTSSSHKSSNNKDSKSRKSSSSSKHSSSSKIDDKKPSSSGHRDKGEKSSEKSSRDKSSKDSKSSSHRSDKDRKRSSSSSSKSKQEEKEKEKKDKKEADDHYSVSGRGNHHRRSTDRDSNDGSSSSKGSHHPSSSKSSGSKRDNKGTTSKSDNTSTSGSTSSPSDKDHVVDGIVNASKDAPQTKPIVRVERHLGTPISTPPRLPFVPDITLKKPKIAANFEEAKKLMKVRKFLDEEQKRMNQEAALLLEFQANVRPCMSQAYSHIPGPEIEFACVEPREVMVVAENNSVEPLVVDMNNIGTSSETVIISDTGEQVDSIPKIVGDVTNDTFENFVSRANGQAINEIEDFQIYEQDLRTEDISTEIHEYDACNNGDIEEMQSNGNNDTLDEVERPNSSTVENNNEIKNRTDYFEITIITEELSEDENAEKSIESESNEDLGNTTKQRHPEESRNLEYFTEQHKYEAEIEYNKFNQFYNTYSDNIAAHSKMYLMNCSKRVENMLRDESLKFGQYEIVNYHKNGYTLPPKTCKSIVRNLNVSTEVALPVESSQEVSTTSPSLSPVKLGYTFGLSPRDDTDLDEIMNNTSRRQVMQIILGEVAEEMPTAMPRIDYCTESNIDVVDAVNAKRKLDVDTSNCDNNNENVYSPSKLRKLSCSDQISSTTEESDQRANSIVPNNTRSKYLGKARRVGLPKPRKPAASIDPSLDKSTENHRPPAHAPPPHRPNGKVKSPADRSKVQRYDTSDLYKPKLHYLSRRNHIS